MQKFINLSINLMIVITLCLVTFSITYAWFQTVALTDDLKDVSVSGKLDIVYDKGQDVTGSLEPSVDKAGGLNVTVKIRKTESSVDALGSISLIIREMDEELSVSGLKWEVYKTGQQEVFSKGTFEGVETGDTIDLVQDYELISEDTEFTVYIWLSGNETDNTVLDKLLDAYIEGSARSAPVNLD